MKSRSYAGWRVWYETGEVYDSKSSEWRSLPDDGVYLKVVYYSDGTRQLQQADRYFVAPHFSSEDIHGTCNDSNYEETKRRYPGAVFKRGKWGPDDYYRKIVDEALDSVWER